MSMNILNSKVIRMFPGTIQSDFLLGFQILAGESLPLTIKQWKYYTIISHAHIRCSKNVAFFWVENVITKYLSASLLETYKIYS